MSEVIAKKKGQAEIRLVGIYLRNVSVETGHSPLSLPEGTKPEIRLELRVQINSLGEQDEVVLDFNVTGRDTGGRLLYFVKLQQIGCFIVKGAEAEQKAFFLNTVCPQMLYPYASHVASTLVTQAGFPALYLTPIDFVSLYAQQQTAEKTERHSMPSEAFVDKQTKWASVGEAQAETGKIN